MSGSNKTRGRHAKEGLAPGDVATIYFDGRTLSVVSITPHPTETHLLSCRDRAGKVTLIDTKSITAVIRHPSRARCIDAGEAIARR
jgi:hypothetical protein